MREWIAIAVIVIITIFAIIALAVPRLKNAGTAPEASTFKGPTGAPYVNGPTGLPPGPK